MPYGGPGVENIGRGNQKPEVEVVIIPVVVVDAAWMATTKCMVPGCNLDTNTIRQQ